MDAIGPSGLRVCQGTILRRTVATGSSIGMAISGCRSAIRRLRISAHTRSYIDSPDRMADLAACYAVYWVAVRIYIGESGRKQRV